MDPSIVAQSAPNLFPPMQPSHSSSNEYEAQQRQRQQQQEEEELHRRREEQEERERAAAAAEQQQKEKEAAEEKAKEAAEDAAKHNKKEGDDADPKKKKDTKKSDDNKTPADSTSGRGKGMFSRLFGRGGKKDKEGEEKDPPKAMVLDSEAPKFDPKTGKWIFPETEEEKALKAKIAAGPPPAPAGYKKMAMSAPNLVGSPAPPATGSNSSLASGSLGSGGNPLGGVGGPMSVASHSSTPGSMLAPTSSSVMSFASPSSPLPMSLQGGGGGGSSSMAASPMASAQRQMPMMMMPSPSGGSSIMLMASPTAGTNGPMHPTSGGSSVVSSVGVASPLPPLPGASKRPPIPMANQYVDMFNS